MTTAPTHPLAVAAPEPIATSRGRQLVTWLVMVLLVLNIAYSGVVLFLLTPDPARASSFGCTGRYLPTQSCYWLKGLPAPGITDDHSLFLPLNTSEAGVGLGFGALMFLLVFASGVGVARGARWRGWAIGLTLLLAIAGWNLWRTIPLRFEALGQVLSILFVASMLVLSAIGVYALALDRPWARKLLVSAGIPAVLIGAIWVLQPAVLIQVLLGVLLILLLLERQGRIVPPLSYRIASWTVIPLLVILALVAIHMSVIAPAEGITAATLNWQTVVQRTLEHTKIVLMASLIAIATAVPLGILITRDYKFAFRTRRVFVALPRILMIAGGYLLPALLVWWMQGPAAVSERGMLRALGLPALVGFLVGAAVHYLILRRVRQGWEWAPVESWQSLAPATINIANVGQTVPSIAVLGLSMGFLGIGFLPAIVALYVRALLPILHNTVAGLMAVDANIIEAAHGMGMTRGQVLLRVELPLAMAVIFAGIRTSVVFNIAVGALAFYIGAGGLGHLIAIGIALSNDRILITGGILTALMAIIADFVMSHIEDRLAPPTI